MTNVVEEQAKCHDGDANRDKWVHLWWSSGAKDLQEFLVRLLTVDI
jgi:hypothetical protein